MDKLHNLTESQTLEVLIEFELKGLIRSCELYNKFLELNNKPLIAKTYLMPAIKKYHTENFKNENS